MSNTTNSKLRVALVGAGAIAEQFHLPVLAGHDDLELQVVCDVDVARAASVAKEYGFSNHCRNLDEVSADSYDCVIIATPPAFHFSEVMRQIEKGKHVLVEKPIALSLEESQKMVDASSFHQRVLCVGLYKRLLPSVTLIKTFVENNTYGTVRRITANWGGLEAYHSATLGLMKKETAGGGILMDLGPHVLDILTYWIGVKAEVVSYKDDSCGGIESDCEAELAFSMNQNGSDQIVPVSLRLSRVKSLQSGFELELDEHIIRLGMTEKIDIEIECRKTGHRYLAKPCDSDPNMNTFDAIRNQLDDWLLAIRNGTSPNLNAATCLPAMKLIDECYRVKSKIQRAWHCIAPEHPQSSDERPRILVTGAGGFVGSKLCEWLNANGNYAVRAMVRRPGSASRIARYPVEIVQGDLSDQNSLNLAARDCEFVVHCAVGTDYGKPKAIYDITVNGTRKLINASLINNVKRFIHLSSIGIHDPNLTTPIKSSTPAQFNKSDWYGYTKALAEDEVQKGQHKGLETLTLRPGCIYGPFGYTFTMNPIRAITENCLLLEEPHHALSNTIYIDNLCHAIILAIQSRDGSGLRIPIVDDENISWFDYFSYFASKLGKQITCVKNADANNSDCKASRNDNWSLIAPFKSVEAKQFAKRLLQSDPIGTFPRQFLRQYPAVESRLKTLAGLGGAIKYKPAKTILSTREFRMTPRRNKVDNSDASQAIGFQSIINRETSMRTTWDWLVDTELV